MLLSILTEALQGIRKESEFNKTRDLFNNLLFLPMRYLVFLKAAEIYRALTLRKSMDCMIASVAIENNIPLLHNDKDFKSIEAHYGLNCYK